MNLRKEIVESVKKGVPKAETARRFGVDRATVKRYCKRLDERGTLQPRKAPGKAPKLDEKARKLLAEDLERSHRQRDGAFSTRGRGDHKGGLRDLRGALTGPGS